MRMIRCGAGLAALALSAHVLAAQEPTPAQPPVRRSGDVTDTARAPEQRMRMMDAQRIRLDTLVDRMNRAAGSRKIPAMADVIIELVAREKLTQEHMRRMMDRRSEMMHMMEDTAPAGRHAPAPGADSVPADSAGHSGHHPED